MGVCFNESAVRTCPYSGVHVHHLYSSAAEQNSKLERCQARLPAQNLQIRRVLLYISTNMNRRLVSCSILLTSCRQSLVDQ